MRSLTRFVLVVGVLLLGSLLVPARAQDAAAPFEGEAAAPLPAPRPQIDLVRMLRSKWITQNPYEDAVWTIAAQPGRKLIHIPLLFAPAAEAYDLSGSTIDVRGGRFVTFHLQPDPAAGQRESATTATIEAMPADAPRAMRKLTVEPGGLLGKGQLSWKLDRFIPNAVAKDVDLDYVFKVDPRRFEKLDPGKPTPITRGAGEDARAFQMRKRQQEADLVAKQRAFRERREAVIRLPDTFTVPMPDVVWAVYEVADYSDDLTIGGVSDARWSMDAATLAALRELVAMSRDQVAALDPARRADFVARLQALAASKHPLSERLAAYAVNDADLARLAVAPTDEVAILLRALLTAGDREAKLTALTEISSTIPPSQVTLGLIKEFAGQFDPTMQLVSLRGLLTAEIADPQQAQELITSANQMLADPNGPPPGDVLAAIIETVKPQTLEAMTHGIEFERMPDARRAEAIAQVIAAAPTQPLAAAWLDLKLLGSPRGPVVKQTVDQLAVTKVQVADEIGEAAGGAPPAPAAPSGLLGRMRGLLGGGDRPAASQATAAPDAPPAPVLTQRILIASVNHGYFAALGNPDSTIGQAAWMALPCFRLPDPLPADVALLDPASDPYALLIANVHVQPKVAPTLVPFFRRHSDPKRVPWSLMQLVLHNDDAGATQAAKVLLGSKLAIEAQLTAMPLPQRQQFARRMYQVVNKTDPLVTGLLRWNNPQNPWPAWFSKQISEGTLPAPSQWAEQIRGEDQLLLIALSTDRELALAGAAALVSTAGGAAEQAHEVAKALEMITPRTAEGARPEWQLQRRRILADRLRAAAGDYDLKLRLFAPPDPAAPPPDPKAPLGEPVETITLGAVQLVAEGDALVMAAKTMALSSPPDQYVIRVDKLAELKNFLAERVQQLPLDQVEQPLDLTADADRRWQGVFMLPDGAKAQLTLEPIK